MTDQEKELKAKELIKELTKEQVELILESKKTADENASKLVHQEIENLKTQIKTNPEVSILKKDIERLEDALSKIESNKNQSRNEVLLTAFENPIIKSFLAKVAQKGKTEDTEEYSYKGDSRFSRAGEKNRFKAFNSLNVHTINTVNSTTLPTAGSTGIVPTLWQQIMTQILGTYETPRVTSNILDFVMVEQLNAPRIATISYNYTANFQVTDECEIKPFTKLNALDMVESEAEFIVTLFCYSMHLEFWYADLYNDFKTSLRRLLLEEIPKRVNAFLNTKGIPFTPTANTYTTTAPDDVDALASIVADLYIKGVKNPIIRLSPGKYTEIIREKATDGHTKNNNNGSIRIVDDRIYLGMYQIQIIQEESFGIDELQVGDFSSVKVAIHNDIIQIEKVGTVVLDDNSTSTERNINIDEIGIFVAYNMPTKANAYLIRDTFTNVKTLITA